VFLFFHITSFGLGYDHLVHDFNAHSLEKLFVFLHVVAQLPEHVRLDLQLHHLGSHSFDFAFASMFFLDEFLQFLMLVRLLK